MTFAGGQDIPSLKTVQTVRSVANRFDAEVAPLRWQIKLPAHNLLSNHFNLPARCADQHAARFIKQQGIEIRKSRKALLTHEARRRKARDPAIIGTQALRRIDHDIATCHQVEIGVQAKSAWH